MAKTNDDIYDILSDLVSILKQQNTNKGGNLKSNIGIQDDIFKSLFNGFDNLRQSAERLSEKQTEYAASLKSGELKENIKKLINGYTEANGDVIEGLKDLNKSFKRGSEKFNTTQKYYKEIAKTMDEQNSIVQDINVKKANLFGLEQKLYNDKLKIERAELEAKQKFAEELERQSKREVELKDEELKLIAKLNIDKKDIELAELEARLTHKDELEKLSERTRDAGIAFAETAEKIKVFKEEIETIKEEVKAERREDIEETEKIKKDNTEKQENINITHENAMAKKEEKRLEGYNKKGQKKANAERKEILGNIISYFKENSKGRIFADGVNMAAQGAAGAAKTVQSGKMDVSGMADKATSALSKLGPYGAAAGGIVQILKVAFEMYSKVDKAASDYARSVGGGHAAQVKMRNSAAELAENMSKLGKTAYLAEEILERMTEASETLGRNLEGLSTDDLRSLKDLKNFGISDDAIAQMDTFGISVHNTSKQLADLYGESGKRGLNAKATIKAFTSNLKMAQNYTFARGQKALMDMAMKSAQLKFNLRDAEQFANKVSTLEGAMTAGAQLSVLGGNFAMQGNPLAMMYNGLNDVEGLQNQMLAMTKGMARWDSSKGQLDITAFDRERLKAMSQATGIDYSELTSMAFNQSRLERVSQQLGGGFSKDEEEYIKNLASLDEKGNAYIRVGDKEYSMNDIRDNKDGVRNQLKAESEAKDTKEGADMGDIWSETRGIQDKLDDLIKTIKNMIVKPLMGIAAKFVDDEEMAAMKLGIDESDKSAMAKLKQENKRLNSKHWFDIWNSDVDDLVEYGKRHKMGIYAEPNEPVKRAGGGFVSGDGGPTEDAIHARLSNGEFVVNAEATTRHRPLLERINRSIRNGSNLMRAESIMGLSSGELRRGGGGNQKIDVSPIKIEFGTLTLKIGDLSRVLDSNEVASRLLNNSAFVDNIVKEIGIRANFGYRKDDSSNKFLDTPFVRSF
jgi:hypothetical protein